MASDPLNYSKRDAVNRALAHDEVWPVPYYINADTLLMQKLRDRIGSADLAQFAGNYLIWEQAVPLIPPDLEGDRYTDIWGITWAGVGVTRGYVVHHPVRSPSLKGYRFPESCSDEIVGRLRRVREQSPDTFLLVKLGDLFERAHYLRGMEALMLDMYDHPAFVDALFERITRFNLSVIDRLADADIGIDGLSLSDDYGWQNGLIISPRAWRRFVKPHLKTLFEQVRARGFRVFLHSDGAITPLVRELIDLGIEALHPVQSESMDVGKLKREFGSVLTLFGGVGTQVDLPQSGPAEIKSQVHQVCATLGRGGGFILAPGIGLHHDVAPDTAIAFIDAAKNQPCGAAHDQQG